MLAHARALLTSSPEGRTAYIHADLRDPAGILADPVTREVIDFTRPAFGEADRCDPQRVFLVDGNRQQITAIGAQAEERGLKVSVLIDYIHVSGYLGKTAAALHPGDKPPAFRRSASCHCSTVR